MHVILLKAHTHAGHHYEPDEPLEVTAAEADWLIAQGVAKAADAADDHDKNVTPIHKRGTRRDQRDSREENNP